MQNTDEYLLYAPDSLPRAEEVARKYGLHLIPHPSLDPYFLYDSMGLCFLDPQNPKEKLQVNFTSGRTGYRLTSITGTAQPLLKALGFSKKSESPLRVIDATAGLGGDGMLLAISGCCVTMLERNRGMHALLSDGLERAEENPEMQQIIHERIMLQHTSSIEYLSTARLETDAIYLDPMFPQRKKSALVKKEMRLAKLLAGEDEDAGQLLQAALDTGLRTVVKRPAKAEPIKNGYVRQITGKSIRFDIYNC